MKRLYFVTGNDYKFQIARKVLDGSEVKLVQKKLRIPEIQSTKVDEVASFAARWASGILKRPTVVTDAGYFIEALHGFPGPFIKYINSWLSAKDLLKLMSGKKNRTVTVKGCLAYCAPGEELVTFTSFTKGKIAEKSGPSGETSINEIFIPEGFDKVESEIPRNEMVRFWAKIETYWKKLEDYLADNPISI